MTFLIEGSVVLLGVLNLFSATDSYIVSYGITTTWFNQPLPSPKDYVNISFFAVPDRTSLGIQVHAPYYNDSAPQAPKGRFQNISDYEYVAMFFLGEYDCYLELMFGPHGHYLAYYLEGMRHIVNSSLAIPEYSASIDGKTWTGTAFVPDNYFPPLVDKLNAYAVHGKNVSRQYLALFPTTFNTTGGHDFHKLDTFHPVYLNDFIDTRESKFKKLERRSSEFSGGNVICEFWKVQVISVSFVLINFYYFLV